MTSLRQRALLALLLTVGFYGLSIGIAIGLLAIPYLEWVDFQRVDLRIAFFCVVGAGVILWSIFPRSTKFVVPGPLVTPDGQPRLFTELRALSARIGEAMPSEVYITPDVNAAVTQRGGLMGIGSRRVMIIGLPLMQLLTVSEMRAVLAHEFGHRWPIRSRVHTTVIQLSPIALRPWRPWP